MIQGLISNLPGKCHWNSIFSRYMTKSLTLRDDNFRLKLKESRSHLENYLPVSPINKESSFIVFEIGTGWFPILPIAFFLCGASKVITLDQNYLLKLDRIKEVLRFFTRYEDTGELKQILPWIWKERLARLHEVAQEMEVLSVEKILERMDIQYLVNDARNTGLPASSVDFIVSNTTLEYIPVSGLLSIFGEFSRLANPGALMSHLIITGDHYADSDSSITAFNFLKYPAWVWKLFNNKLHYQNRLRLSDYCKIHRDAVFDILKTYNDQGSEKELERINIAKEFDKYTKDDLLVIRTRIVSRFKKNISAGLAGKKICH